MNWGWKIAIAYSLFVVMMLSLVVVANRQKIDLVSQDYYAQEIKYQQRIDARGNSKALAESLQFEWLAAESRLLVNFPGSVQAASGTLHLYRPSDASQDKTFPMTFSGGQPVSVSLEGLSSGFWRVQLDWAAGGALYFDETTIILP